LVKRGQEVFKGQNQLPQGFFCLAIMCKCLFVWLFNGYQQQQLARDDVLESDSIYGITFYCCSMAGSGSP
jgi:hypothetical protein